MIYDLIDVYKSRYLPLVLFHKISDLHEYANSLNFITIKELFSPPGGLEPPTFRLTAERASRLRHGGL